MNEYNQALLKRLKTMDNQALLLESYAYKIQNRVCDSPTTRSKRFQKNYDTIVFELKKRSLYKND